MYETQSFLKITTTNKTETDLGPSKCHNEDYIHVMCKCVILYFTQGYLN